MMSEIRSVCEEKPFQDGILDIDMCSKKMRLKQDVKVVFFTTQTPCENASVDWVD